MEGDQNKMTLRIPGNIALKWESHQLNEWGCITANGNISLKLFMAPLERIEY